MTGKNEKMSRTQIKNRLDRELGRICLTGEMKDRIIKEVKGNTEPGKIRAGRNKIYHMFVRAAAVFAVAAVIGGTTVYAGYQILNRIQVNHETLPDLDPMKALEIPEFPGNPDETGMIDARCSSYDAVNSLLGGVFLDSELEGENPYMQVRVYTDNKDFGIIQVENYLVGDTENYQLVEDAGVYNCEPGKVYSSSVSLEADYMLSSAQEETGWNSEYLGYFQYMDSYVSSQGYKVNLLETTGNPDPDSVTEKAAVFVADGVLYELKGRVSVETLKQIVDSMVYPEAG